MHGAFTQYTSFEDVLAPVIVDTASRGEQMFMGRYLGVVHPRLEWRTERLGDVRG
jgi:hypothetical protein